MDCPKDSKNNHQPRVKSVHDKLAAAQDKDKNQPDRQHISFPLQFTHFSHSIPLYQSQNFEKVDCEHYKDVYELHSELFRY
jgi:hypothetical protein